MFRILVVEDNRELLELFSAVLNDNGYMPYAAKNGTDALAVMEKNIIDLVISDVMMPEMDGYELVRTMRKTGYEIPVMLITAKGELEDKREGFRAGTDDYMVKPVDVNEMLWRVEALLRRSKAISDRELHIGSTCLDKDAYQVRWDDVCLQMTQKEFLLVYKLATSLDRIFTKRQLFESIWGIDSEADIHTLEVYIGRLRDKLKDNPDMEIQTVRGLGYKAVKKI